MNLNATLALVSGQPVTLHQCAEIAKDHGFDSMTFDLVGPTGRLPCRWLDAYFGFFVIDGQDGFVSANDFTFARDIFCENLSASVDRSGEADETSTKIEGSAEGESAVPAEERADAHPSTPES